MPSLLLSVISGSIGDVAMCPSYYMNLNADCVCNECLIMFVVGSIPGACYLVAYVPSSIASANLVGSLKCFSCNCMVSKQGSIFVNSIMGELLKKNVGPRDSRCQG